MTEKSAEMEEISKILPSWTALWRECKEPSELDREIHPFLFENYTCLFNGRRKMKIFVPMAGKKLEIKWLTSRGHKVTTVDLLESAVSYQLKLNDEAFIASPDPQTNGAVYSTGSGSLRLYHTDFFHLSKKICGSFNGIWDQGAFELLHPSERNRYGRLISSLMARDCYYLLSVVDFNRSEYTGKGPYAASVFDVEAAFGNWCSVVCMSSRPATELIQTHSYSWATESLYLLRPKSKR